MLFQEILSRFLLVFFLALAYGLQRQKSHKPIGFGSFILVAIGACGLAVTALEMGTSYTIPLLSAVVTGIGFLGAGALIKGSDRMFGFTTATSIWLFAIFGLVIGLGYYPQAALVYTIIWAVVGFDSFLEKKGVGSYRKKVTIIYNNFSNKKQIVDILAEYCTRFSLLNINLNKKEKSIASTYLIEGTKEEIEDLLKELYKNKWCVSVKFE